MSQVQENVFLEVGTAVITEHGPGVVKSISLVLSGPADQPATELDPPAILVTLDTGGDIYVCLCDLNWPGNPQLGDVVRDEMIRIWGVWGNAQNWAKTTVKDAAQLYAAATDEQEADVLQAIADAFILLMIMTTEEADRAASTLRPGMLLPGDTADYVVLSVAPGEPVQAHVAPLDGDGLGEPVTQQFVPGAMLRTVSPADVEGATTGSLTLYDMFLASKQLSAGSTEPTTS